MRFFKTLLAVLSLCCGLSFTAAAATADEPAKTDTPKAFEFQLNAGLGGAPGMAGYHGSILGPPSTALVTEHLAVRFRLPKYTPFVLEVGAVFLNGVGANLGIDAVHTRLFRLRLLDLGFLWNCCDDPVTFARLKRPIDVVFGAGVEVKVTEKISVTLDWRVFMPPPWTVLLQYGDFARPMLEESLKGGQLWLGISRVW